MKIGTLKKIERIIKILKVKIIQVIKKQLIELKQWLKLQNKLKNGSFTNKIAKKKFKKNLFRLIKIHQVKNYLLERKQ